MFVDFWKEEYFLDPNFDDMYHYVETNPEKALLFLSQLESNCGKDLFYQMCLEDFDTVQYEQCEEAFRRAFSEILKRERIVAYAADRTIFDNRNVKKLTGLEKTQLKSLKLFCGCRQEVVSNGDFEKLLLCMTRGLASTCALAVNWKILLLMQDLHGCIVYNKETDMEGLKYMIDVFKKNAFVVEPLSAD